MKKIVALILALVMVMGLATVASAADFSEDVEYYVMTGVNAWDTVDFVPAEDNGDGTGTVAYFKGTGANYVECKKSDDGAMKLFSGKEAGDTLLGYVKGSYVDYDFVAEKVSASAIVNCTTDKHAKGYVTYNPVTGVPSYFVKATAGYTKLGLVNGEVVALDADPSALLGGHVLQLNKTNALDALKTTYEYKCVRCGGVYQGVESKVAGVEYEKYVYDVNLKDAYEAAGYSIPNPVTKTLYLVKAAAPVVDTDKVESAQTFDAGIAMYVGMSVMAAAGSAVVLKKKD